MKINKSMGNEQISEMLDAVAAAYKIKDSKANKFKIIAYERASDAVEHLSSEAKDLWDTGSLTDVAGIGPSIAGHLSEIFKSGRSKHFEEVLKGLPEGMFDLMKVSGIGPKTAYKLAVVQKITSISGLEKAVREGKVTGVDQKAITESKRRVRLLLPRAEKLASEVVEWIKKDERVEKIEVLGSLRRRASTVGDIDIAVATSEGARVLDHFVKYPRKTRILEKGNRTASIILPGGNQVDLMVSAPGSFGSLLQHFTGSKQHNISLRELAKSKGMSLSEYGIKEKDKVKTFSTEKEFYEHLGLKWVPPELREDMGEIESSKTGKLPKLIELKDIKGDLHMHSNFDIETSHDLGEDSMENMVKKAVELEYEYLAFTEHNPSKSKHTQYQITQILKKKREKVEQLNSSGKYNVHIFNSLEIDILPDGNLPVGDEGLATLDFGLVSIHSSFKQDKESMTRRVLKALSHPKIKIFAHPTARKINYRESVELDWRQIFLFCVENNKLLEINAEPSRLDLPDFLVREAIDAGVMLTMGADSHHTDSMDKMKYGVSVARRGWATKVNIANTRSLREIRKMLESQ